MTAQTEMLAKVRDGQVIYTKTPDGAWLVLGREDILIPTTIVTATRQDGTEQQVYILDRGPVREAQGVRYVTATFRASVASVATQPTTTSVAPAVTVVDRQAVTVADYLGVTPAKATGECHYCGQQLNARGRCAECV